MFNRRSIDVRLTFNRSQNGAVDLKPHRVADRAADALAQAMCAPLCLAPGTGNCPHAKDSPS